MDFLATVSPSLKLRRTTPKYLLKRLMRGRIPDAIIDRPKQVSASRLTPGSAARCDRWPSNDFRLTVFVPLASSIPRQ